MGQAKIPNLAPISSPIRLGNGIDIIDPILPPRVWLHMARGISVKNDIDRVPLCIRNPPVRETLPDAGIRVQIVDERRPHTRHKRAQLRVGTRHARERFPVVVTQPLDVVEHECHFLEVRRADDVGDVGGADVESVTVCWDGGLGPRFALSPAVGVHVVVAAVGGCAAPLVSH